MLAMMGYDNNLESHFVRSAAISNGFGASLEDLMCLWSTESEGHEANALGLSIGSSTTRGVYYHDWQWSWRCAKGSEA